jgi:7-cyano-7-deazaguanine synthase
VHYGQRHAAELAAAKRVAAALGATAQREMRVDLGGIGGSALTDPAIAVPETAGEGIPVTYVPARNSMLLSLALAWAEVSGAADIFVGVNAVDYSGYPDCRPQFIAAFESMANLATKAGIALGVDYADTVSCYQADSEGRACGKCDSCRLRAAGFKAAGVVDPTRYR